MGKQMECNHMIGEYVKKGMMDEAQNLLKKMQEDGTKPNVVTYNTLIGGYVRKGMMDVLNTLEKMVRSGSNQM